jgi:hypothetical protein
MRVSDTPRTDKNTGCVNMHFVFCVDPENGELVKADFAGQLERELAAATEQRDRLAEALRPFIAGWCDKSCDSVVTDRQFRDAKQALADLALAAVK